MSTAKWGRFDQTGVPSLSTTCFQRCIWRSAGSNNRHTTIQCLTCMLYTDDICANSQWTRWHADYAQWITALACRYCLTDNTQKSEMVCFNSWSGNLHISMMVPPYLYDGSASLPFSMLLNIWVCCVTKTSTNTAAERPSINLVLQAHTA